MSRGLTGVLYDHNGNRKAGVKQTAIWIALFPIRLAVEAVILPVRFIKFVHNLGPLTSSPYRAP